MRDIIELAHNVIAGEHRPIIQLLRDIDSRAARHRTHLAARPTVIRRSKLAPHRTRCHPDGPTNGKAYRHAVPTPDPTPPGPSPAQHEPQGRSLGGPLRGRPVPPTSRLPRLLVIGPEIAKTGRPVMRVNQATPAQ